MMIECDSRLGKCDSLAHYRVLQFGFWGAMPRSVFPVAGTLQRSRSEGYNRRQVEMVEVIAS
ncbi:hypothetical protein CA13_38320 [Planctomycetes bacterium CA13]|uniref:Uncharacterized protein n=1 Tax=Novipirellula herctigrandis TaxID=2527986 RepID=A0A5C5Z596_9BACT|nr:hypothetical protein CA13_38320 [Planctomycetes bacterium CA13]